VFDILFYFLGIRKLVMEVFQNMWFTPIRERPSLDSAALLRKVMNITDVVATSRDMGLEWFEQLLLSVSIYPQHIAVIVGIATYI
jgi:hypothetical protein